MVGRLLKLGGVTSPKREGPLCAECGHHWGMHPTSDLSDTRCRGGEDNCQCKSCIFSSYEDLNRAHVEGRSLVALWEYKVKKQLSQ